MKTLKNLSIITLLVLIFSSFKENINYNKISRLNQLKTQKDSIQVYKTELLSIIQYNSNDTIIETDSNTKGISYLSYHVINLKEKYIENFTYSEMKNRWSSIRFPIEKMTIIDNERTDFNYISTENKEHSISFIKSNNLMSFVYKLSNTEIYYFANATRVKNEIIDTLK